MSKYLTLHQRVVAILNSAVQPNIGDLDSLVLESINSALTAIVPWLSKKSIATLEIDRSGLPENTSFPIVKLPSDVCQIVSIYDPTDRVFLIPFSIDKNVIGIPLSSTEYPLWWEYPMGYISLTPERLLEKPEISQLVILYTTTWNQIEDVGETHPWNDQTLLMETPNYADNALIYYAASFCLMTASASTSSLRQYDTKIDSGTPTDNPIKDMSNLLMQRFLNEVKLFVSSAGISR